MHVPSPGRAEQVPTLDRVIHGLLLQRRGKGMPMRRVLIWNDPDVRQLAVKDLACPLHYLGFWRLGPFDLRRPEGRN